MKTCNHCNISKEDNCFSVRTFKSGNKGLNAFCRDCVSIKAKAKRKQQTPEQRAKVLENNRMYRKTPKGQKMYRENKRKQRIKKALKRANEEHRYTGLTALHDSHVKVRDAFIKRFMRKYDAHVVLWKRDDARLSKWKGVHDPNYMCYQRVKGSISKKVQCEYTGSIMGYFLDYNRRTLRYHIESLFQCGMSWDNKDEWHIDHIVPITAFDMSKEGHVRKCYSLENLRPMWADQNARKRNHVSEEFGNVELHYKLTR